MAARASSAFSRPRGFMVLAPCTDPPTCIRLPPTRRVSAAASGHGGPAAWLERFELPRGHLLSPGAMYRTHHTPRSDEADHPNAPFFTNANRLIFRLFRSWFEHDRFDHRARRYQQGLPGLTLLVLFTNVLEVGNSANSASSELAEGG